MIVITTPTGRIGSRLVELLLDEHRPIRLIARDASRVDQATGGPSRSREPVTAEVRPVWG